MQRRCICGRSARFPICDGAHVGQGWQCEPEPTLARRCFVAGPHLHSLAERLAHAHDGVAAHKGPAGRCVELVALSDGTDLDVLPRLAAAWQAQSRRVISVEAPGA